MKFLVSLLTVIVLLGGCATLQNTSPETKAVPEHIKEIVKKAQGTLDYTLSAGLQQHPLVRVSTAIVLNKEGWLLAPLFLPDSFNVRSQNQVGESLTFQNSEGQEVSAYLYWYNIPLHLGLFKVGTAFPDMAPLAHTPAVVGEKVYSYDFVGKRDITEFQSQIDLVTPSTIYLKEKVPSGAEGASVVNQEGKLVGMIVGNKKNRGKILPANVIEKIAQETIPKSASDGLSFDDLIKIWSLKDVFGSILEKLSVHSLKPPSDIAECAYEMFAVEVSGNCRNEFTYYWRPSDQKPQSQFLHVGTIFSQVVSKSPPIVHIYINQFSKNTAVDFYHEVLKYPNFRVVLNLQHNIGGLFEEALELLTFFMRDTDILLYTRDRKNIFTAYDRAFVEKVLIEHYNANQKIYMPRFGVFRGIKLVVLVNGQSASASELVAGDLQEWGYTLIGPSNTFGKGVAQEIFPLPDGSGIAVPKFEFYIGDKKVPIHKKGLTPNILVERFSPFDISYSSIIRAMEFFKTGK